jgi:hypothetical protein
MVVFTGMTTRRNQHRFAKRLPENLKTSVRLNGSVEIRRSLTAKAFFVRVLNVCLKQNKRVDFKIDSKNREGER